MTPIKTDPHAHDSFHAQHGHAEHDGLYNEDVAHEYSDVNISGLLMFCVGLFGITALVYVAMWGLFIVFERQAVQNDPVLSPHAVPTGQLPPEPRLLTNEPANLHEIKSAERQTLEGFGWVDRAAGRTRIPIEDAKKKVLHDGLPVRAEGGVTDLVGTSLPARGESSSGRIITAKPAAAGAPVPAGTPAPEHREHAPQKSGGH
jgi:hypothetical protein